MEPDEVAKTNMEENSPIMGVHPKYEIADVFTLVKVM